MALQQLNDTLSNETSMWKHVFTDLADPRTNNWFLIGNPIPLFGILLSYLYFVKVWGPNYMKDKKPFEFKRLLMVYNLAQVAANVYLFAEALDIWKDYNWNCQPLDRSYSPSAMKMALTCYFYFLNKLSDLLDTVFFVLRKKDKQISFLHVFHHTLMPFATWNSVKYFPGGHATFVGLANTFVHILLYLYYYLAAFGPEVQKYLWWKKYLTKIQLIQFCLMFLHSCQLFIFDCEYPRWTVLITLPNAAFFYFLFSDFYKKSYTNEASKSPMTNDSKESVKQNNKKIK